MSPPPVKPVPSVRPTHLAWGGTSLIFGLFLIYFGNEQHLFVSDDRWSAVAVLAMAWLSVVAVTGVYYRRKTEAGPDDKKR